MSLQARRRGVRGGSWGPRSESPGRVEEETGSCPAWTGHLRRQALTWALSPERREQADKQPHLW